MKKTHRISRLIMALVLIAALSISVLAASASAGAYGTLTGSLTATGSHNFSTTTKVTQNPDSARLYVRYDVYTAGGSRIGGSSFSSSAGATILRNNYDSPTVYGETVDHCYACHEVRGASGSYAAYTFTYV